MPKSYVSNESLKGAIKSGVVRGEVDGVVVEMNSGVVEATAVDRDDPIVLVPTGRAPSVEVGANAGIAEEVAVEVAANAINNAGPLGAGCIFGGPPPPEKKGCI